MFRLRLPRFSRSRRFFLMVFLAALAVVLLCVGTLLWRLGAISSGPEREHFVLGDDEGPVWIQGLGVNLHHLARNNWLSNGSFEPLTRRWRLRVADGTTGSLFVLNSDQDNLKEGAPDRQAIGAKVQVLRFKDAQFSTKKEGRLAAVDGNQLADFHPLVMPPDLPSGIEWQVFAARPESPVYAFGGSGGYVLTFTASGESQLWKSSEEVNIVGLAACDDGFVALDADGHLYYRDLRAESSNWQKLSWELKGKLRDLAARTVADQGTELLAVGDEGLVYFGNRQKMHKVDAPTTANLVTAAANAQAFYLAGEKGVFLETSDGQHFSNRSDGKHKITWTNISLHGNRFLLGGQDGYLLSANLEGEGYRLEERVPQLHNALFLGQSDICGLDRNGSLQISRDAGKTWTAAKKNLDTNGRTLTWKRLWHNPAGVLFAQDRGGHLYYAQIGTVYRLVKGLDEGVFSEGDILFLEAESLNNNVLSTATVKGSHNFSDWYLSAGLSGSLSTDDPAPGGGQSYLSLRLRAEKTENEQFHALYLPAALSPEMNELLAKTPRESGEQLLLQVIEPEYARNLANFGTYRLSFWARSTNRFRVVCNLAGLLYDVRSEVQDVGGEWKRYQFSFIVPEGAYDPQTPVRLCMNISGFGRLDMDRLFFRADGAGDLSPLRGQNDDKSLSPGLLRMQFMPIGTARRSSEYWLQEGEQTGLYWDGVNLAEVPSANLGLAFQLLAKDEGRPCFVVEPWVSESELRHLMQFLFGAQSTVYGQLRAEQGMSGRWSDYFTTIYFEFAESPDLAYTDSEKRAFVDYALKILSSCPEYKQVKKQLVFIDGMQYKEGNSSSKADYHKTIIPGMTRLYDLDALKRMSDSITSLFPRDPSRASYEQAECLQSSGSSERLRAADFWATVLSGLGDTSSLFLADFDALQAKLPQTLWPAYLRYGRALQGASTLPISSPDIGSKSNEGQGLLAKAFKTTKGRMIFYVNLATQPFEVRMYDLDFTGASLASYDSDGQLLNTQELRGRSIEQTVFPGGFVVVQMP